MAQLVLLLRHRDKFAIFIVSVTERRRTAEARMRSPIRSRSNSAKADTIVRNNRAMPTDGPYETRVLSGADLAQHLGP